MGGGEGYIEGKGRRTWYDVCVKCSRIVSPRHTSCPKCGGTEFKGTIRESDGKVRQKGLFEASETKDNCECSGCHQDLSACVCGEAT